VLEVNRSPAEAPQVIMLCIQTYMDSSCDMRLADSKSASELVPDDDSETDMFSPDDEDDPSDPTETEGSVSSHPNAGKP
jgi:hypothetical protein